MSIYAYRVGDPSTESAHLNISRLGFSIVLLHSKSDGLFLKKGGLVHVLLFCSLCSSLVI